MCSGKSVANGQRTKLFHMQFMTFAATCLLSRRPVYGINVGNWGHRDVENDCAMGGRAVGAVELHLLAPDGCHDLMRCAELKWDPFG
jgi:hypothetical protein